MNLREDIRKFLKSELKHHVKFNTKKALSSFAPVKVEQFWGRAGESKDGNKIERKTQRQALELGGLQVCTTPAPNVFLIALIYFTVSWETKSQANRDHGWQTLDICTYPQISLLLPVPSSKIDRTFSPLIWASSVTPLIVPCISRPGNLPEDPGLT